MSMRGRPYCRLGSVSVNDEQIFGAVGVRHAGQPAVVPNSSAASARMADVQIDHRLLVLDTGDLDRESSFWADVLGGTVDDLGESHMVVVDAIPQIGLQFLKDHIPPTWGQGSAHRVRIDMWVGDPVGSHNFVVDRGATVLDDPELVEPGNGFRIYASPAGHPFALCWRQQ